ncbi:hypothetical protein CY0110_15817 [Crocosphaera chwakensis CCY0110]|uniref:Uncharacterized protein n=1 Tax=Crocosphaera chwakensis CCY0110 TaxID=391612 RepID=A3IHJ5_9CHRO|nr:hypothetical protein CY0110_15817 [Crocosphaera chwakensis CCY0110]
MPIINNSMGTTTLKTRTKNDIRFPFYNRFYH